MGISSVFNNKDGPPPRSEKKDRADSDLDVNTLFWFEHLNWYFMRVAGFCSGAPSYYCEMRALHGLSTHYLYYNISMWQSLVKLHATSYAYLYKSIKCRPCHIINQPWCSPWCPRLSWWGYVRCWPPPPPPPPPPCCAPLRTINTQCHQPAPAPAPARGHARWILVSSHTSDAQQMNTSAVTSLQKYQSIIII